jgi:hypothetical protein
VEEVQIMERLRQRLSFANVMSVAAVFIALGGSSYAALSKNSVGKKQLKKGAVTTKKIKDGAVNEAKIADGTIRASHLSKSLLSSLQDSCPAGMTRFGNTVCIDTVPRVGTATMGTAIATCSQANLRLPSATEAYMLFNAGLMQLSEFTWVDTVYARSTGNTVDSAVSLYAAGTYFVNNLTATATVRCATVPGSG